jgi:hypothetical protein
MGAQQFVTEAIGKTAAEAFKNAKEEAYYESGHGRRHTGTIAEKSEFKMCLINEGENPGAAVDRYLDDDKHFSDDKWGPAACIDAGPIQEPIAEPGKPMKDKVGLHRFIFFGWASS